MSFEARPEEGDVRSEHRVLIFAVVAAFVLGSLLLLARFASGEEPSLAEPLTPTATQTASLSLGSGQPLRGGAGPALSQQENAGLAPAMAPVTAAIVSEDQHRAPPPALSPPPEVGATAFAILERACGAVLWGKNERTRLPPASLTKIITAMVVERRASLNEMVNVNVSGSQMARRGSSVMGVEPNMKLSVLDLLYGLFLPSGNDAALALAAHVGRGNVNRFIDLMNEEVRSLQMKDTHFTNPHGLDSPGLYSSALDMAIAGHAFLDEPLLGEVSSAPDYMPAWSGPKLKNGNKLLQMYPGAFGIKIGYTTNAHQTIVAAAERDGREVIVSLFGSDSRYLDSMALFDWAFTQAPSACSTG